MPPSTLSCDLCGLPLPAKTAAYQHLDKTYRFCCTGCKQVFIMLMDAAETSDPSEFKNSELYRKCLDMGIIPRSEAELNRRIGSRAEETSDHADDRTTTVQTAGAANTLDLVLKIDNMWCPACAWVIDEALGKTDGIVNSDCSFTTDRLRCEYNPVVTSPEKIAGIVEKLGYRIADDADMPSRSSRREFTRFALSAFLSMNVMMLSFALYSGFFTEFSAETIGKLSWPIALLATVVMFYGGRPIFVKALRGLGSAAFGMETLITAGSLSAYFFSVYNLVAGSIHLYFDTASMLIALVLLGKTLERKAKDRVRTDLESFFSLSPAKVRICSDRFPQGRYANADQLQTGDLFQVTEGEIVPADGKVVSGSGLVDESTITGEPLAISLEAGAPVKSGARIVQGTLRIEAQQVGSASMLGQMIDILQRSLDEKASFEGSTDRLLKWFVPSILLLAVGTGVVGLLAGLPLEASFVRMVTVMVISCPCALGVAIPLARVAGISVAGKKGLLARTFASFEKAPRVDTVVFDKTGTITHGHWSLLEIRPVAPYSEHELLQIAVSLEADSTHAIALEIRRQAEKHRIDPLPVEMRQAFENGISGSCENTLYRIGAFDFLSGEIQSHRGDHSDLATTDEAVYSPVYIGSKGKLCGVFVFGDRIRPSSAEAVAQLKDAGLQLHLISGDNTATCRRVAAHIGIDHAHGNMLPQDKASYIKALQAQGGLVLMVGDGVNDAPALLRSDLSMAVYAGSHLSNEAAEVTLMRSDPRQVYDFLAFAARVNRKVFQNLVFSLLYNVVSIPIAMSGLLNPLVAVCAMLLSSLTVIGNTILLIRQTTDVSHKN